MEVVIWGVTSLGEHLINNIWIENENIRPSVFIDSNTKLQNTQVKGIPVISYEEFLRTINVSQTIILLSVRNAASVFQILGQLKDISVVNVGIVKTSALWSKQSVYLNEENSNIVWTRYEGEQLRIIPRIEINLIDACNLKCKGCTHFSSIYTNDSRYPITNYMKDLTQLRKVGKVFRIRLLGGEPLLLDNLDEYVEITRTIFEESDIEIVTNGLLIPKIKEKVLLAIKSNNVSIIISSYPPTLQMKKQIIERLNKYHIWHQLEDKEIVQFSRNLTLEKKHNEALSNNNCFSSSCTFLRNGKLYKCPFDALINDFYLFYKLQRKHDGGISLYQDKDALYKAIINYAFNPVEMCKYCAEVPEMIPWSVETSPVLEDWLYRGESL